MYNLSFPELYSHPEIIEKVGTPYKLYGKLKESSYGNMHRLKFAVIGPNGVAKCVVDGI